MDPEKIHHCEDWFQRSGNHDELSTKAGIHRFLIEIQ
jgi:hypothetical protein